MNREIADNPKTKEILIFTLPILLNSLIQFSFTFIDSLMVAPLGEAALGGIGQGGILYNVILTFFFGLFSMYTPLLSRVKTDQKEQGKTISYFWMLVLMSVISTLTISFIIPFSSDFLALMGQPVETTESAQRFLNIQLWSTLPIFLYFAVIQTANVYEKPHIGLFSVIIGTTLNILLNWLFLSGTFGSEFVSVEGVSLATFFVRCFMFVFAFIFLIQTMPKEERLTSFHKIKWEKDFFMVILSKGIPRGIINLNDWLTSFLLVLMVGWSGLHAVAANQVTDLLSSLMYMVPQAFCTVITIIVSKQIGKNSPLFDRKKTIIKLLILTIAMVILTLLCLVIILPYILEGFSLKKGTESYNFATQIMIVHFVFYIPYAIHYTMLAILDAFLDTKIPSILTVISSYFFVLPLAFLSTRFGFGAVGIWIVEGISLTLLAIIFIIRVFRLLKNEESKSPSKVGELV